jgi:hypothetical protein
VDTGTPYEPEKKSLSCTKDKPILISALPDTDEESPRSQSHSPEPISDKLNSSIPSLIALSAGHNALSTSVSEDARAEKETPYQLLTLYSDSPKQSFVDVSATPTCSSTSPIAQHVELVPAEMSESKLRVLVTKGDQCPSKFIAASIAINSEATQHTPLELRPEARDRVSWIETVTEAGRDRPPELSETRISGALQANLELSHQVSAQEVWPTKVSLDVPPSSQIVGPGLLLPPPDQSLPELKFTVDNRADSPLTEVEVRRFIKAFEKDARALIPRKDSAEFCIGVIMWQSLEKFYAWYAEEEEKQNETSLETKAMRFELLDVSWQQEKIFLLSEKSLNGFMTLRQYIWDLFWVSRNLNSASVFRIMITRAPEIGNGADFGRLIAAKSIIQAPSSFLPLSSSHSDFGNAALPTILRGISAYHQHKLPSINMNDAKPCYGPVTGLSPYPKNTSPAGPGNHKSSALPPRLPAIRNYNHSMAAPQPPAVPPNASVSRLDNNWQYHLPRPKRFETQKRSTAHGTLLPSTQSLRVTNTAQIARDPETPLAKDKDKDRQTDTTQILRTEDEQRRFKRKANEIVTPQTFQV